VAQALAATQLRVVAAYMFHPSGTRIRTGETALQRDVIVTRWRPRQKPT
jgi:hypothetical protein